MPTSIKKISILGCGWLGLPLAEQLQLLGFELHGSTTTPEKLSILEKAGIRPYLIKTGANLDVDDETFFETDLLILNIPPGRKRDDVEERYPHEIRLVVDRALEVGAKRLIFVSSTSIYPNTNTMISEKDDVRVKKGSGLALTRCEQYLEELKDIPLSILRLGGLVGGSRKAGRFLAGKKNLSNGAAPVNMLHRDDAIGVILQMIQGDHFGRTFNVCADEHPSRRDFYRTQALKEGLEPPTFTEEEEASFKIISNTALKTTLGYIFKHPDPMAF